TPPQPITTTDAPASTWAQRVTAPTPVGTAHPIRAACGQGMSVEIGTSISAGHTTCSANVPRRANWLMSCPLRRRRCVPSSMTKRHSMSFRIDAWSYRPYAKRRVVAHGLCDHASILKLIEWRFGLEPLTERDRRAAVFLEAFDFGQRARPPIALP